MSARYSALLNPQSQPNAERELDDAFDESDGEDDDDELEYTPLTQSHNIAVAAERQNSSPGTYDFERDYDYPPPGSPPRPSAFALPNDIGNSNGQLPASPVRQSHPQPSFFRRALGGILPTHYAPVPTDSVVRVGGGVENDGVFANVMAKPGRARAVRTENGDLHMVPEDSSLDAPPTYADAQADTVPPYWETTVHAPLGLDGGDILVDNLPTGSVFIFGANLFTSFFFQFVGFLLTYILATSHSARYGSRAGLGLTLIQYGFYSKVSEEIGNDGTVPNSSSEWSSQPTTSDPPLLSTSPPTQAESSVAGVSSREWMSFLLMTLGWFLLLSSIIGFWRVKHWEASIRASSSREPVTSEDVDRDVAIRRNIERVFGLAYVVEGEGRESPRRTEEDGQPSPMPDPSERALEEEARLERALRDSGLL